MIKQLETDLPFIPKKDLEDGAVYIGYNRNSLTGRWNAKNSEFIIVRYKFEDRLEDTSKHPEDDDGYALFYPFLKYKECCSKCSVNIGGNYCKKYERVITEPEIIPEWCSFRAIFYLEPTIVLDRF